MYLEKISANHFFGWLPGISAPPAKHKISLRELGDQVQVYVKNNWDILAFQAATFAAGIGSFPGFGIAVATGVVMSLAALLTLSIEERKNFRLSRCQLLALAVFQVLMTVLNSIVSSHGIPAPLFRQISPWALGLTAGLGGVLSPRR